MNTADSILQTALSEFAERGYSGTSLNTIANEVGIKKPSIYNHFKNKEALFEAVVKKVYVDYMQTLKIEIDKAPSAEAGLKSILWGLANYLSDAEEGKFYMRYILFPPEALADVVNRTFMQFEEDCNKLFLPVINRLELSPDVTDEEALDALYCLLDGWTVQTLYYSHDIVLRKREASWKVFMEGVSRKESKGS
ncbi:TetR/AcrR family transcriptional regulator [Paenalkalicoccus suaedae]|uniref:TetR/AcrR family transcriptional regulator n=1 Tax=Paenalkalicoccus suaedae TaxID=2592382 RepID=A0A859FCJ2_9BACI|nr:TetR/AcrR family transcriptional regulator [Paenalkalicoccus suaedae]QKS70558.1 TetR/AcrR family transcriptional regulator [Paenalkalicoccus suaedae]